ncbi:MAG TPA: acid-activated periplasmic chaperone HdeA [Candidatus Competibacteraceae bacterium]|nr:acid-activated periplasmic chaperone HdeA [Candidatus Competibacteraceae bacterium]
MKHKAFFTTADNHHRVKALRMRAKHGALGVLLAAVIAGPTLAADQPVTHKPLAKMTCEDFIGLDESFQPKAVYWAAAYAKGGKPEAAVLDVDGIESVIPVIIEECQKTPKASFWEKVKAEIKKIEKKM